MRKTVQNFNFNVLITGEGHIALREMDVQYSSRCVITCDFD